MQAPPPPTKKQWALFLLALATPLWILLQLIIDATGRIFYTLDDPYIHLTLARNILAGHYGINLREYSAPSSSILWPFFLAPFGGSGLFEYVPLVINILAFLAASALIFRQISKSKPVPAAAVATLVICVALNYYGLVFTGMEHSLQILLVVVIAYCCINAAYGNFFWISIVLLPLIRYEGLAISAPVLTYLIVTNTKRKQAIAVFALTILCLVLFSVFLNKMGLGYLPSSIQAKSVFNEGGNHLTQLISKFQINFRAEIVFLLLTAYTLFLFRQEKLKAVLWVACPTLLHLIFGGTGWYGRYEVYYYTWITLLLVSKLPAIGLTQNIFKLSRMAVLAVVFVYASKTLIYATMTTPFASRNIFDQQEQMGVIVRDYLNAPVAVNDLGLVSFRSRQYVLDLWGLGSNEALNFRIRKEPVEWISRLMQKHNVEYAIVYESWFKKRPENWIKVATLNLPQPSITPADSWVAFYAASPEGATRLKSALLEYREHSRKTGFYVSFD